MVRTNRFETEVSALDICVLYYPTNDPWGGANQFMRSLIGELCRSGQRVTSRPEPRTRVVLLNAWSAGRGIYLRPREVAQLRATGRMTTLGKLLPDWLHLNRSRKSPVLVHRVDGVPELTRGSTSKASRIQPSINRMTDYTIFQSEFCRTSFVEHSGIAPASDRVILNGVDPDVFFPNLGLDAVDGTVRLVAASWSSNPLKGFATLADVSRLPGVELTFVGNWCSDVDSANVRLAGVKRSRELAEVMRSSHAMIHAGWNESCSNAIVEAMACGLPVIYRDSGGNRELAGKYGVPLSDDLALTLATLRGQYTELREKVLRNRSTFLISRAAQEYLTLFREAIATHNLAYGNREG